MILFGKQPMILLTINIKNVSQVPGTLPRHAFAVISTGCESTYLELTNSHIDISLTQN